MFNKKEKSNKESSNSHETNCSLGIHSYTTLNDSMSDHSKKLLDDNPMMAIMNSSTLNRKRCKHCPHIEF